MKKTINKLLLAIIIIILSGCMSRYPIISTNEISLKNRDKYNIRKYIVVDDPLETLDSCSDDIAKTLFLVRENDVYKVEDFLGELRSKNTAKDTLAFCEALLEFYYENYEAALSKLSNIDVGKYEYLRYILIAQCMREACEDIDNPNNKKKIMKQYQNAMDSTTSPKIKKVINMHIKYLKFGE